MSSSDIPSFEKGTTVTIQSTVADDNGNVVEPDDKEADIEIKDLDTGDVIISSTQMQVVKDTVYEYDWQTTEGMSTGEYEVETRADVSSDTYVNRDRIRLEDIIIE